MTGSAARSGNDVPAAANVVPISQPMEQDQQFGFNPPQVTESTGAIPKANVGGQSQPSATNQEASGGTTKYPNLNEGMPNPQPNETEFCKFSRF